MSKPIVLSTAQWTTLKQRMKKDYPASVFLLRTKMKDTLGFVVREYEEWNVDSGMWSRNRDVRLDFYNEPKRTMFILKYSEYLEKAIKESNR